MKLHGSVTEKLVTAVQSAKSLRGHPVYEDTLQYWRDLLGKARAEKKTYAAVELRTVKN